MGASPGLANAIDADSWRAVGRAAKRMHSPDGTAGTSQRSHFTGMSRETQDTLDGIIDSGNWHGIIDAANNASSSRRRSHRAEGDKEFPENIGRSIGLISIEPSPDGSDDIVRVSPGLSNAIDAHNWHAVRRAAERMRSPDG